MGIEVSGSQYLVRIAALDTGPEVVVSLLAAGGGLVALSIVEVASKRNVFDLGEDESEDFELDFDEGVVGVCDGKAAELCVARWARAGHD